METDGFVKPIDNIIIFWIKLSELPNTVATKLASMVKNNLDYPQISYNIF